MKKLISVLSSLTLLLCATSAVTAATAEPTAKENALAKTVNQRSANERMMPAPDEQLKRLTKGLVLTTEQQEQIKPILTDEFAQLKKLRNDENLNPKEIQKKVEELRGESVAKMKKYLNREQVVKLDLVSNEIKENKQKRIKENRKTHIGSQPDGPAQQPKQ